jgi:nicotinamide mononucleotide adenylyltransferase
MAGIKHLSEIYKKQGAEFLDELFGKDLTVSEKLNGMSFSFEKNSYDGSLSFYKRDQVNPISKIDRVLMKYYESPISHIQGLDNLVLSEIPDGWRFGMEFFINPSPVLLSYQRIPKNGLVLTHIIVKNEFGDIERTIIEKEELEYWANLIGVENPPIIFQGKLSDEQKVVINDFINSPNDHLKNEYGTKSFAKFLIGVLNKDINKSYLNDSLEEPIEGVVFRFGPIDGTGDSFTAKILDPMFEDITKQNNVKKASYFPSDIYGITILEVMNFILDRNVDSFSFEGEDPQDKYISYISSVFNEFVEENGEKYLGLDFQEPEFLKQEGFQINSELIKDEKTKALITEDESYQSLFKVILSAFRKIKKRPGGFFTQGAIEQFNLLVREISNYLNNSISVVESMIPTFDQFRKTKKTFVPQEETEDEEEEDTEEEVEEEPIKKPKKKPIEEPAEDQSEEPVVIEAPKEGEPGDEVVSPVDADLVNQIKDILGQNDPISDQTLVNPGKEVNIVIGKFQPFNNGHLKLIKKANQTNGLPVVIMVVKGSKNFIKGEVMDRMMSIVSNELPDIIDSYKYIDDDLLSSAINGLGNKYNPKTLTIGSKRLDNYLLQSRSLKKRKKLDKDFVLQTAPEWVNNKEILNDLGEKNYLNFKKNVPKGLASIWEELTRCYEASK